MRKIAKRILPFGDGLIYVLFIFVVCMSSSCSSPDKNKEGLFSQITFRDISMQGELRTRILRNFDRLESSKYQPDNVFLSEEASGSWPGDTEGRTILGLVLDARASCREPLYLEEIINRIPGHLNEAGYMGIIYKDKMNEQQLSGNGWMLRGLCEYYAWKKDEKILQIITSIANNLFVKGKGFYAVYPIDPAVRDTNVGREAGTIQKTEGDWMLSSDIGCVFIGMDGLIHAYEYLRTPELKEVIEEMIHRFLMIDPIKIKAQTHATLTACRGLMRYAEITGDTYYIDEAEKRWLLYKSDGMTENHENYNWFDRFDTWTEPCAIIDSYLLAVQLWEHTMKPEYRDDAELIYYNGICHTQRNNGGFGCDNCPGNAIHDVCLKVHVDEAHWCCTMRGGEGLGRATEYAYFIKNDTIFVPFYHESELSIQSKDGATFVMHQTTNYPFTEKVAFTIKKNTVGNVVLKLASPAWMQNKKLKVNGQEVDLNEENGFIILNNCTEVDSYIELSYQQKLYKKTVSNSHNTSLDQFRVYYGPLILGLENSQVIKLAQEDKIVPLGNTTFKVENKDVYLSPVYHLMDSKVWSGTNYKKQILF